MLVRYVCPWIEEAMPGRPGAVRRRPALMCDPKMPYAARGMDLDDGTAFVIMDVPDDKLTTVSRTKNVKPVTDLRTSTDIPEAKREACLAFDAKAVQRMVRK